MDSILKITEISQWPLSTIIGEIFYVLIGLMFCLVGIKALRDSSLKCKYYTAGFWFLLAFTFIVGPYIPKFLTGICIVFMALLTALKRVKSSKSDVPTNEETRKNADKIGYKIFISSLVLAISAVIVATFFKQLGANNAIGVAAVIAFISTLFITKAKPKDVVKEGTRLMDNIGPVGILPQVLAALGALFTASGVGNVITTGVRYIIPEDNKLISTIIYCLSMALFTATMGNGFAAFSVITVGVGIPFLIEQGANPIIVGAMGLTAGYCGTLMTPMAANFNIMPAALLEIKNKYNIIKIQFPVAMIMLVIHIILIYFLAF